MRPQLLGRGRGRCLHPNSQGQPSDLVRRHPTVARCRSRLRSAARSGNGGEGRSRSEIRRYALGDRIDWLEAKPDWTGLQAVGRVESTRSIDDQTSTECHYFLCSFPDRDRFATTVRSHWGIENPQHWILDVHFGGDACRTRKDHSAQNLALMRRRTLNLLSHNGPPRNSLRRRKRRAALNDDYRLRLLFGTPPDRV